MRKTFKAEVTEDGTVTAIIATLGVRDHDGDVAFKDSFPEDGQPLVMSAYNHKSWEGALPYGHGTLRVTDTQAKVSGQFFMDTTQGLNAFRTVKAMSDAGLQEWSYSYHGVKSHKGQHQGEQVRFLDKFSMHEFSPVIKGAGLDTYTESIKGAKQLSSMIAELLTDEGKARWGGNGTYVYLDDFDPDTETAVFCTRNWDTGESDMIQVDFSRTDTSVTLGDAETPVVSTTQYLPKGIKFAEHSKLVLAQVDAFCKRATEVVTLRAEKGKSISEESKAQILKLHDQLAELLADPPPNTTPLDDEVLKAFIRSQKTLQRSA